MSRVWVPSVCLFGPVSIVMELRFKNDSRLVFIFNAVFGFYYLNLVSWLFWVLRIKNREANLKFKVALHNRIKYNSPMIATFGNGTSTN